MAAASLVKGSSLATSSYFCFIYSTVKTLLPGALYFFFNISHEKIEQN